MTAYLFYCPKHEGELKASWVDGQMYCPECEREELETLRAIRDDLAACRSPEVIAGLVSSECLLCHAIGGVTVAHHPTCPWRRAVESKRVTP